ncbi:hypothetical protein [Halomonas sp. WWR20]
MDALEPDSLNRKAYDNSYIVVFDMKNAVGLGSDEHLFEAPEVFGYCQDVLFKLYVNELLDDAFANRSVQEEELSKYLEENFQELVANSMFFRLREQYDSVTLEEVLALCKIYSHFPPWAVIQRGEVIFSFP